MRAGRARAAGLAAGCVLALLPARAARAQEEQSVRVARPEPFDSLRSATPRFTVVARGFGAAGAGLTLELQVATSPAFDAAALVYRATAAGDSADFVPARPLPSGASLWWRALARIDGAVAAASPSAGPQRAADWLDLLSPDAPNGAVLASRRPRFVWSSAAITQPPGPWRYDVEILGVGTGERIVTLGLTDTTFVPYQDLEANTSYRWAVRAYLPATGDAIRVESAGSFVITSRDRPLATLLYQNFPNPFPTATVQATCVWFDLARPAAVRLEILSLRGDLVRRLYPVSGDDAVLGAGRYGRADVGSNSGCDPRYSWDGRSDGGRMVTPGVYLLRLGVGTVWETRRILFTGAP